MFCAIPLSQETWVIRPESASKKDFRFSASLQRPWIGIGAWSGHTMLETRLSLIVCTYRRPHTVGKLLTALANQTRRPDEILIVDGSDDSATESLIASLQA